MGQRIVVVEDDPGILGLIGDVLIDEGYDVVLFASPLSAIEQIAQLHPDLVILDYLFAGEASGWRVLQALKLNPETADIPVIICTALLWVAREMDRYVATREVTLLWKPFSVDDLLAAVQRMLSDAQQQDVQSPTA